MIKRHEFGEVEYDYDINISDYTNFIGEVDGVDYPYIEVEHDKGYSCGRCSGGCDRNIPPSTKTTLVYWEPDNRD